MNANIIDTNRFAPYGEPLDPVAKNTRLTNSPFGFTGEMHDVEARLVYLRARHYEPSTMRLIQQDTYLGETQNPLSRHLYMYGQGNPLTYVDPSGHLPILPLLIKAGANGAADMMMQAAMNYFFNPDSQGNIGKSFGEINWWQVARSAAEGLIPWKTPGGVLGKAALAAIGDVTVNALNQRSEYTRKQALQDFAVGFIGDLAGSGFGKLIEKYGGPAIAKGLNRIGFKDDFIEKFTGVSIKESTDVAEDIVEKTKYVDINVDSKGKTDFIVAPDGTTIKSDDLVTDTNRMLPEGTRQTDFIATKNGTAVHANQTDLVESITEAGAVKVGPTNQTSEVGEIFQMDTPNGPMEIRVMEGRIDGGPYQGPRTINTVPGSREYIYPNGERIRGAIPKAERKGIGHIHGQY